MTHTLKPAVLAPRMQFLRERRGWTAFDFATRAHVDPAALGLIERAQGDPFIMDLARLAGALGLHLHELISPADDQGLNRLMGLRVRSLREARGLLQGELADHLNVTPLNLGLIEAGQMNLPLSVITQLPEHLGVERGELLNFSEVSPVTPERVGGQVQWLLADAGASGADVAVRATIGPALLRQIVDGEAPLTLKLLVRLADALGVPVRTLIITPD